MDTYTVGRKTVFDIFTFGRKTSNIWRQNAIQWNNCIWRQNQYLTKEKTLLYVLEERSDTAINTADTSLHAPCTAKTIFKTTKFFYFAGGWSLHF